MPRKKTIQPAPLEIVYVNEGIASFEIEIRDESCNLISRGSHKRDTYEKKLCKVMERVVDDYLTPSGRKLIPRNADYLRSAATFTNQYDLWGYGGFSGADPNAIRKKLYTDVKRELKIFEGAIARNVKNIA